MIGKTTAAANITPERAAKGDTYTSRAKRNGPKVVRTGADPFDRAARDGKITAAQLAASQALQRDMQRTLAGSSGPRDSLDIGPRGGVVAETAEAADKTLRALTRTREVIAKAGADPYIAMLGILICGEPTGPRRPQYKRWRSVLAVLDVAVQVYGITGE